jgi:Tol biopolymer transport system component
MRGFSIAAPALLVALTLACSNPAPNAGGSPASDGGASGDAGGTDAASDAAAVVGPGSGSERALPASTFLYVSKLSADQDVLMAFDRPSGQSRVVTDLRGDGSNGWSIAGVSLSPDRTRIAVATLYGPTKADVDTKLATRSIWTFATDGSDFRRLTPVFPNTGAGKSKFAIEVGDPSFSKDGTSVFYAYGEYWYEGTTLEGASAIWNIAAAGGGTPALIQAPSPCSLVAPSVDPSSGNVAVIHSVCIPDQGQKNGIYLHSADGSGVPQLLVASTNEMDIALVPPRWIASGQGFSFIAAGTTRGLYAFDMTEQKATPLVIPQEADTRVIDAAPAPDLNAIVYCLQKGEATNLHLIDLTTDPASDTEITNDGKSCHPVW